MNTNNIEDTLNQISTTLELIGKLRDSSRVSLVSRQEGGDYLHIDNRNILKAKEAYFLSREGVLFVVGSDPSGTVIHKHISTKIIEWKAVPEASEVILAQKAISFCDTAIGEATGVDAYPYSLECVIIDPDVTIKNLDFIEPSMTSESFKFGIELSNGIVGELVFELRGGAKDLTLKEINERSIEIKQKPMPNAVPGFEMTYPVSQINIGAYSVTMDDWSFAALACDGSCEMVLGE